MKKSLIAVLFSLTALSVQAEDNLNISSLAANKDTKAAFKQMLGKQTLPKWVTQGGTNSQNKTVEIAGSQFLVLNACKPHDCSSQQIAVLYSPSTHKMSGVFSSVEEKNASQKLLWLSVPDELSIDGKTILYASLTGSLENHPDSFNYK